MPSTTAYCKVIYVQDFQGIRYERAVIGVRGHSDATSKLSGVAAEVLGTTHLAKDKLTTLLTEDAAGYRCNLAMGAWETSRSDSTTFAFKLLDAEKHATDKSDDADAHAGKPADAGTDGSK